jgi:hypothetical protein
MHCLKFYASGLARYLIPECWIVARLAAQEELTKH